MLPPHPDPAAQASRAAGMPAAVVTMICRVSQGRIICAEWRCIRNEKCQWVRKSSIEKHIGFRYWQFSNPVYRTGKRADSKQGRAGP
ncbi:MAG: hypothetical protein KGL54_02015 [Sphingomonadales bacterium]|nr:hypothetical protein [Sphingomonadales bacterium]